MRWLGAWGLAAWLAAVAVEVPVIGIVGARCELADDVGGGRRVTAELRVPDDAPPDLGVAVWAGDAHGSIYLMPVKAVLHPGINQIDVAMRSDRPVSGPAGAWTATSAADARRTGLAFWTAHAGRWTIAVDAVRIRPLAVDSPAPRLLDVSTLATAMTGERWSCSVRPDPFPADPEDAEAFTLDLVVSDPEGNERRLPGYHNVSHERLAGGDREVVIPSGPEAFAIRWRPSQPGVYQLRLEAAWGHRKVAAELPSVTVTGPPVDAIARLDGVDPRFLNVDGKPYWPVGINLRSVWDLRSRDRLGTAVTPDLGTDSYEAYFDRFAAGGADAAEVWLSSWNLALEWRADWQGFHGIGQINQANAARLDRVLELAWARGMRLLLVINNHGQASDFCDVEWDRNPWNRANGGPLTSPVELFTSPEARAGQERIRRYLVARYADHPAVLGWKLWTEMDLTTAGRSSNDDGATLRDWHAHASARWQALDTYRHPITSHWSTDYRQVYAPVASLPGLEFLCIDAYHAPADQANGFLLADLLHASATRRGGLVARYGKGVLVTEFGGQWDACPPAQLEAEHASAAFAGLVSGHLGAPMLWWFEWVDQGGRFAPYRAVRNFLVGEDLRSRSGSEAQSVGLTVREAASAGEFWGRGWSRPGRLLGYIQDRAWGANGTRRPVAGLTVRIGDAVPAGRMIVAWWDADRGVLVRSDKIEHSGGALDLPTPTFSGHLAFKLSRAP